MEKQMRIITGVLDRGERLLAWCRYLPPTAELIRELQRLAAFKTIIEAVEGGRTGRHA
jgi:hypothetical protein